jgi:hypothetical protein
MIELAPLTVADARYVLNHLSKQDAKELQPTTMLAEVADADGGWTIKKDGTPLAILVGKRNAEHHDMLHTWAAMTKNARGNAKGLLRLTRKGIEEEGKRLGATLFITFCRSDRLDQDKWVRMVGFKPAPEGNYKVNGYTMKGYCYGIRRQDRKEAKEGGVEGIRETE